MGGGGGGSMGRGGLRLTSGLQKHEAGKPGGHFISTVPHKISGPTSHPHPFSSLCQQGSGAGACHPPAPPESLSPTPLSDLWSRPPSESSQDRGNCLPHSHRGLRVPSQVSVCLPHKGAVRPSTEPQEGRFQVSGRPQVSVQSRTSRAA